MEIHCEERYREAVEYAKKIGDESLRNCIARLKSWENENTVVHLYSELSPLSFYFQEEKKNGNRGLNGGVLYHGNPDESMAVCIDGPATGWRIHT